MRSEFGKMTRTVNAKGSPTGFSIDVYHTGLARRQTVRGPNQHIVQQTALAKGRQWDQQWQARQQQEQLRAERVRVQGEVAARQRIAQDQTVEAQEALSALDSILSHALSVDDKIDWDSLKNIESFGAPYPVEPPSPPGREPQSTDEAYQPKLGLVERVLPSRIKKKQDRALELYESQHRSWQAEQENYVRLMEQFEATCAEIDRQRLAYLGGDREAVRDYCDLVLSKSEYPDYFPKGYSLEYGADNKLLIIDYQLPSMGDLPTLREVSYIKSRNELAEKHISKTEAQRQYDRVLYQIALRTIFEILRADEPGHVASVVFNGYVESTDAATGQSITPCVLSVQANRDEFAEINLEHVDPKACFRSLKGVAAPRLHSLTPVAPILRIQRSDARFVSGYAVAQYIQEGDNLAAMDWLDFEHLIRELFEKEYALNGAEVKITRPSRDGGVDAIAFDPDPLHGGKTVIQAKRYTGLVGVTAVRDLYGTVLNEGANRGILVTTSTYGPDSYEFAKGKPIVLIDGGNLLHMLEKHGYKARIDLQEAKRLASEQ